MDLQYFRSTGLLAESMEAPRPEKAPKQKKAVQVTLHGHSWPVYPMNCRGKEIFRVFHRVSGKRVPKTFPTLAKAEADAKSLLRELHGKAQSRIHLTDDEKLDWRAAKSVLQHAGLRTSLETVCRHYADLVKIVGDANLLTDLARRHSEDRGRSVTPVPISALRDVYIAALEKKERSRRHVDAQRSHTGQFLKHVGAKAMSHSVSREVLQDFVDSKKGVDARTKKNLLDAVKAMMSFGKSNRNVPTDWDEANHVIMPVVRTKPIVTYTPEELTKLFAAASERYRPILALAAFAGIRSSELELLDWNHVRLLEHEEQDRIIKLDVDVTEESSRRTIRIHETLRWWLTGPFKVQGRFWTGKHDDFYRRQQQIANNAGVAWKHNALRHTAISAQVAITRNVAQVAYESGNSVAVIKRHYLDLMPPGVAEAWFAVTPITVLVDEDFLSNAGAPLLKAITGEDPLSPEYKNSNMTPSARPIKALVVMTANTRLRIRSQGDKEAWRRRLIPIPFEEVVPEAERVPGYSQTLLNLQGPGILNWGLEGVRKLNQDGGRIVLSERQKKIRDALLDESEAAVAFAREAVVKEARSQLLASALYKPFVEFCNARGWAAQTPQTFLTEFKRAVVDLYGITQATDFPGRDGNVRGWRGLRLKKSDCGNFDEHDQER